MFLSIVTEKYRCGIKVWWWYTYVLLSENNSYTVRAKILLILWWNYKAISKRQTWNRFAESLCKVWRFILRSTFVRCQTYSHRNCAKIFDVNGKSKILQQINKEKVLVTDLRIIFNYLLTSLNYMPCGEILLKRKSGSVWCHTTTELDLFNLKPKLDFNSYEIFFLFSFFRVYSAETIW